MFLRAFSAFAVLSIAGTVGILGVQRVTTAPAPAEAEQWRLHVQTYDGLGSVSINGMTRVECELARLHAMRQPATDEGAAAVVAEEARLARRTEERRAWTEAWRRAHPKCQHVEVIVATWKGPRINANGELLPIKQRSEGRKPRLPPNDLSGRGGVCVAHGDDDHMPQGAADDHLGRPETVTATIAANRDEALRNLGFIPLDKGSRGDIHVASCHR